MKTDSIIFINTKNNEKIDLYIENSKIYYLNYFTDRLSIFNIIRTKICSAIFVVFDDSNNLYHFIYTLKTNFPHIPIIAIFNKSCIELAWKCGKLDVDLIIEKNKFDTKLPEALKIIRYKHIRVSLKELGFQIEQYSDFIKKALYCIEDNYLTLFSSREIAECLDANEFSLVHEFRNNNLISPKKILLSFKITHSIKLMRVGGYNLKEISKLSGFSNEKRFSECYNRILGVTPGIARLNIDLIDIKSIYNFQISSNYE